MTYSCAVVACAQLCVRQRNYTKTKFPSNLCLRWKKIVGEMGPPCVLCNGQVSQRSNQITISHMARQPSCLTCANLWYSIIGSLISRLERNYFDKFSHVCVHMSKCPGEVMQHISICASKIEKDIWPLKKESHTSKLLCNVVLLSPVYFYSNECIFVMAWSQIERWRKTWYSAVARTLPAEQ